MFFNTVNYFVSFVLIIKNDGIFLKLYFFILSNIDIIILSYYLETLSETKILM